ncbi:MAG: hypothetical protein LC772_01510 [Chloroflexi bacterium]|nr:hypothetical protein [Chloroflexota bacterium]
MLRAIASISVLLGAFALMGCGSSGGDNSVPSDTPVTVSLTSAQDVQEVVVLHRLSNNDWTPIYDQQFRNQNTINIPLDLITGDQYEVDATTVDPVDGSTHVSKDNFTAGTGSSSGGYTYGEPYYGSRSVTPGGQHIFISVPSMARK